MTTQDTPLDLSFGLDGKVALVTGGASGIGAAIVDTFVAKGARVAVVDLDGDAAAKKAAEHGDLAAGFACDVTDPSAVDAAVDAVLAQFGHIDILVNSAGVAILAPAEDLTVSAFDTTINVNLKGTFLVCQAVGRHLLAQGSGKIINLASQAATVALDQHAAYCASKFGVVGLSKVLASEWARPGGHRQHRVAHGGADRPRPQGVGGPQGRRAQGADPDRSIRPAGGDRCDGALPGLERRGHGQRRGPPGRRGLHHPVTVARRRSGR